MTQSSNPSKNKTSWNKIGGWYDEAVGEKGHYYHQAVVIPGVLKLLNLQEAEKPSVIDIACGQGVLSRHISPKTPYTGLDAAASLIRSAREYNKCPLHEYLIADATKKFPVTKHDFSHATIILALQNIEEPLQVFKNAAAHLRTGGRLVFVINHPCFRIPRQSSWKIDEENKTQYRRIDRYMSSMKIPIQTHPGQGKNSPQSWSFHHPLSSYSAWLHEAGFTIDRMEEWCSDKVSTGKAAKMENRSREEIPLFMAFSASKK